MFFRFSDLNGFFRFFSGFFSGFFQVFFRFSDLNGFFQVFFRFFSGFFQVFGFEWFPGSGFFQVFFMFFSIFFQVCFRFQVLSRKVFRFISSLFQVFYSFRSFQCKAGTNLITLTAKASVAILQTLENHGSKRLRLNGWR